MGRFYYYATENIYQGLHGIEDSGVIEAKDMNDACDFCFERCTSLMEDYDDIMTSLGERAANCLSEEDSEDEEKFYDMLDEVMAENALVAVWAIDEEKAKGLSIKELNRIAYYEGSNYFIKEYCIDE